MFGGVTEYLGPWILRALDLSNMNPVVHHLEFQNYSHL